MKREKVRIVFENEAEFDLFIYHCFPRGAMEWYDTIKFYAKSYGIIGNKEGEFSKELIERMKFRSFLNQSINNINTRDNAPNEN
jgi:hypothetical protein